jgi:hypothetical protein
MAEWSRAEAVVSGTLQYDPTTYQAAIAAMAAVLDHLRAEVTTPDALCEAEFDPSVVAIAGTRVTGVLGPGTIVAAALAVRRRELAYQVQLRHRLDAIEGAADANCRWAAVADEAAIGTGRELLVHLPTGLAITTSTGFDLETGEPVFAAVPVKIDLSSGAVTGPADDLGGQRLATDVDGLDRNIEDLVAAIEAVDIRRPVE